ncbi:hypothetical protein [Actinoplanes sp. URMC 104]|uniref:hypothetical protein n=1 Tax=Actinoplanes sp. URMC 104 TaxID=3423409 RepID=UPI003F1B4D50
MTGGSLLSDGITDVVAGDRLGSLWPAFGVGALTALLSPVMSAMPDETAAAV